MKRSSSEAKLEKEETKSNDSKTERNHTKKSVYDELFNLKNEKNEKLSSIFEQVRDSEKKKKSYADTFADPITFGSIKIKFSKDEYESVEELISDFKILVDNLHEYVDDDLDNVDILSEAVSRLEDEALPKKLKRRGRKKKREIDSAQVSETESDVGSTTNDKTIQTIFFALIATMKSEDNNRFIGPTFVNLPKKSEYPQYYDVIDSPINLRMIAVKIKNGDYVKNSDLFADLNLMAKNAKTFNEAKSVVYQDAAHLQRSLKIKLHEAEEIPKRKFRGRKRLIDSETSQEILDKFVNSSQSEDPLKEFIEKEKPRKTMKTEEDSGEDDEENSEGDSEEEYSEPVTPSRRRLGGPGRGKKGPRGRGGRASNNGSRTSSRTKLSDDEASLDSSQVASPTSTTYSRSGPSGSFTWCLEEILARVESEKDSEDNQLCSAFIKLPSKRVYPDYYEDIKRPICIQGIRKKLKGSSYETAQEFMSDIELLVNNAMEYNVEGSKIYEDAMKLLKIAKEKCKELSEHYPDVITLPSFIPTTAHYNNQVTSSPSLVVNTPKNNNARFSSHHPPNSPSSFSNTNSMMSSQNTSLADLNEDSQSSKPEMNASPTKRINSGRRPLPPEEARRRRNNNLYNAVWNMTDDEGRLMRDMFITIPSREDYPDYFDVITNPIDLTMIKDKIDRETVSFL